MIQIDITDVLSQDLKSRFRVQDFYAYILNSDVREAEIDFRNVKFATRSFIDEFYNVFLKNERNMPFRVHLINVPADIGKMFESVSRTQVKMKTISPVSNVRQFENAEELLQYMNTLAF